MSTQPQWFRRELGGQTFTDFVLVGTPWFVARPECTAHARAIAMPYDYRYALYEAGASPSGCAALRGFYRTLNEAKSAAIAKAKGE